MEFLPGQKHNLPGQKLNLPGQKLNLPGQKVKCLSISMLNLITFRKEKLDEKKAMRFDYSSVFTDDKGYIYCAKCSTKWLKKYYHT